MPRRSPAIGRARTVVALAAAFTTACGPSRGGDGGAVVLVVDTNLTPGRDFDTLRLRVEEDGATEIRRSYGWDAESQEVLVEDAARLPFTVSVQNAYPSQRERIVSLTAWKDGAPVFARDATFVVPPSGAKELRLTVEALCFGATGDGLPWVAPVPGRDRTASCADGKTCLGGRCMPAHVNAAALRDYDPRGVFGGEPAPSEGGRCADLRGCFAADRGGDHKLEAWVWPRRGPVGCAVDVQAGVADSSGLTVAYEVYDGVGRCGPDGCIAWLDEATPSGGEVGWNLVGSRVVLPDALCDDPLRRVYLARKPSVSCTGKTRATPACAPWSSVGPRSTAAVDLRPLDVEGGSDDGAICAATVSRAFSCGLVAVVCGDVLVEEHSCATRGSSGRYAACGPCTGKTEGMKFVRGGEFLMGSDMDGDGFPIVDQIPRHRVRVHDFWLDEFEVTAGEFRDWFEAPETGLSACGPDLCGDASKPACTVPARLSSHPVNCISWFHANWYCSARGKRLPTEEEWEYAARGGARQRPYPWGTSGPTASRVCSSFASGGRRETCTGGEFEGDVSAHGVRDLGGSLSEWTSSGYSASYAQIRTTRERVVRGANWTISETARFRSAFRDHFEAESGGIDIGFRCAR